jgi:hypothetical protein
MVEAAGTSETSVNFYGAVAQKTAIFILAAVRTIKVMKEGRWKGCKCYCKEMTLLFSVV